MQAIRPHDNLFKFVFGEPEQMAELLRACLPAAVAAAIDWSTLQRVSGSFVDRALKGRETDLLFTARMGRATVLLYLVPEHKSANDRFATWQVACYVVRILEQWRRDHPDAAELPAVLPIIVYHGDEPWQSPRTPRDLVDWRRCAPELAAFLRPLQLDLPYLLLDLSQFDETRIDALRLSAVSSLTLRFLQFLRSSPPQQAAASLQSWAHLFAVLATHPRGRDVLFALLSWYIASSRADLETVHSVMNHIREENAPMLNMLEVWLEDVTRDRVETRLQQELEKRLQPELEKRLQPELERRLQPELEKRLQPELEKRLQPELERRLAHDLQQGIEQGRQRGIEQGMQQGVQQGRLDGQRTMLACMLRARFGDLSPLAQQRLADADMATLQAWAGRLLHAMRLDDVFAAD